VLFGRLHHNVVRPELLGDEIDDLAQTTRIKYWLISQKEQIACPKAYIRSIIHNESVNMVRQHKPALPLPKDEDGELYQGNVMVAVGEGMQDQLEDILPLVEAFMDHGMDIEAINWPMEKDEMQRLRASLSIARKKLRSRKKRYNFDS
jgi:DNA-directed RNA polymerase specialized sigma24 family protein